MGELTAFATTAAAGSGSENKKRKVRRNIDERMREAQKKADLYAARLQRERAKIARLSAQSSKRARHLELEELIPLGRALFEALARLHNDINPRKSDGTATRHARFDWLMGKTPEERVLWLYKMLRKHAIEYSGGVESEVFGNTIPSTEELAEWHKICEADRARRAAEMATQKAAGVI